MKTTTATLLVAVLAGVSAIAKDRDIQVRSLALDSSHPSGEVYSHSPGQAGKPVKPKTFLNHESDKATLAGQDLVFTTREDAASTSDAAATLGKITIGAKQASAIVIFLPGSEGNPASTVAVDDSKTAFPAGSTLILNLTPYAVKFLLEGQEFKVAAGANNLIKNQPVNDNQMTGMKASYETDGAWTPFASGMWTLPGAKRVLQIITMNPATKQPEMKGFRDISAP